MAHECDYACNHDPIKPATGADLATDEQDCSPTIVDADGLPKAVAAIMNDPRNILTWANLYMFIDAWGEKQRAYAARDSLAAVPASEPVDMILHCPKCGLQHIDAPDERTTDWANPVHRSHLCHGCGHIWRPADVPTNGVAVIATKGSADSPAAAPAPVSGMPDLASFWVVEKFEDGKPPSYWDGGSSRSFVTDIDKAIHFCRHEDCFWATRGWHWGDTKLTEHVMLSTTPDVATLPAAPAPTEGDKFREHLQWASDEVATWPAWKQRVAAAPAPTEQAAYHATIAESNERMKDPVKRALADQAGELPPLPTSFAKAPRLDGSSLDTFTANQMRAYARAALAKEKAK